MITINFNYLDVSSTAFKNKKRLKAQLVSLFKKEGALVERIDYIFCTDAYLLGINKQFLNHNFYTDIITFNLANKKAPIQGEIYISMDRVKENAQTHQTTNSTLQKESTRQEKRIKTKKILNNLF